MSSQRHSDEDSTHAKNGIGNYTNRQTWRDVVFKAQLTKSTHQLHFVRVTDDAKCILVMRMRVCVSLYSTDPDVILGNGTRCPLVVHY